MRPTGKLHVGHYFGALENYVKYQDDYECYFMVADLHALTTEYENPQELRANTEEMVLDWLSAGISPEKSAVFVQSHLPEHSELHLLLSMLTPLSWLERNPTYKEQMREMSTRDLQMYGFLGYPVLQAADILIYKANAVPVGEDQLPHLELTREIVRRFNHMYKEEVFPEPQPILTQTPKLPGTDGRKMSKSYDNAVFLSDDADTVHKKIFSMITDPQKIRKNDPGHPEICNVFSHHNVFTKALVPQIEADCKSGALGCVDCKKKLTENMNGWLSPFRERRKKYEAQKGDIKLILSKGKEKASQKARATLNDVKKAMGVMLPGGG